MYMNVNGVNGLDSSRFWNHGLKSGLPGGEGRGASFEELLRNKSRGWTELFQARQKTPG